MRATRRVLLGLLFLSSCAFAADEKRLAGYEQVQLLRGSQNHLLLPAKVNGRPATFLLDTGADISFLQANRAAEFGVQQLGRNTTSSGLTFPLGQLEDLRAGDISLAKTEVALYSAAQFGGPLPGAGGQAADGILGLDFLRRSKAVINCRTKQIFFQTDPNRRLDLAATTGGMGFTRIPLEKNARGYLTVPCSIRGRSNRLILDTGAFVTGLDDEAARSLELPRIPSKLTARGLDGRVRPVELAQVDDLRIGSIAIAPQQFVVIDVFAAQKRRRTFTGIRNIEAQIVRTTSPGSRRGPTSAAVFGLLGNELLDQRRAIIDLGSMTLFLK